MDRTTETHGFCETCRSSYRRNAPHACNTMSVTEARGRLEAWFAGDVEIYQ